MTSSSESVLPASYKHQTETRTENEILLTNKLTKLFSALNLKRIRELKNEGQQIDKNEFYFVCLCGIPPFENEYENLELPGEKTVISLSGLLGEYSEKQYLEMFKIGGFENEAQKTRKVILQKSQKHKIVVVYHSFGSFTLMNYLRLYPDHRISGLIDIGGAPIRFYPLLTGLISNFHSLTPEFLLQNSDMIHQQYINAPTLKQAGFIPFRNKYQTIIFLKLPMSKSFQTMFDYMRNLPKVLKLFLYGSKDRIFPEHLIHEKALYYSYVNTLDPEYEAKLNRAYSKLYGHSCHNVQERFIFCMEGGQHSLHMQPKYNQDLKTAIWQYLLLLRTPHSS